MVRIFLTGYMGVNLPTVFQFVCIKDILCLMIERSTLLKRLNDEHFQFVILFPLKNRALLEFWWEKVMQVCDRVAVFSGAGWAQKGAQYSEARYGIP